MKGNINIDYLNVPGRTIMGAGPSSADSEVLNSLSSPIVGYLDPWYLELLEKTSKKLQKVWRTKQRVFAITGSGSAGMEAGLMCLTEPGDTVIICSNGFFCERLIIMAERIGLNVVALRAEWDRPVPLNMIKEALEKHPHTQLICAVHAETSVGVLTDIKALSEIIRDYDAFFMVDCVTSLGGVRIEFDLWNIDYAYSATQKCLAAPPGLSPVALSDKAYNYIASRKQKPLSWYLDLKLTADYWGPQHTPHHTSPITMVYALYKSLHLLLEEGLEERWARHYKNAHMLWDSLQAMDLVMPVEKSYRLPQVTIVKIPASIDSYKLRFDLLDKFGIEVSRGLGGFDSDVIRIGLMGDSCRVEKINFLLKSLKTLLASYKVGVRLQ